MLLDVTVNQGTEARCYADAVLYRGRGSNCEIIAMSLIGPEQIMRMIAAGCANPMLYERPFLSFFGPPNPDAPSWSDRDGKEVRGRWSVPWSAEHRILAPSACHTIAMPRLRKTDLARQIADHIIIAPMPTDGSDGVLELRRAIYRRLLEAYTTPLLPLDDLGQPKHELDQAKEWANTIGERLTTAASRYSRTPEHWTKLETHPDQTNRAWDNAGFLHLTQTSLDNLVCELIRTKAISIPVREDDTDAAEKEQAA